MRARSRGPKEVLPLGLGRARDNVKSDARLLFLLAPTQATSASRAPRATSATFREATADDADAYARDIGTDSPKTFASRLSGATRCYLVVEDSLILHATWVTTAASWVRELRRYFRPPPGEAYTYESFTRAEARGRGAYPFTLTEIRKELAREGVSRLWVGVEADNSPSIRAITKAGFEIAFEVAYRRRWGRLTVDEPVGEGAQACKDCLVRTIRK